MRVLAFAPSLIAEENHRRRHQYAGLPHDECLRRRAPVEITVSVVIAVATLAGIENNPALYLGVNSPQGRRLVTMQMAWQWDDVPDVLVKFRSFLQYLPIQVETEGVYTLGLYDDPDATESEHTFPLAIFLNPNPGGI